MQRTPLFEIFFWPQSMQLFAFLCVHSFTLLAPHALHILLCGVENILCSFGKLQSLHTIQSLTHSIQSLALSKEGLALQSKQGSFCFDEVNVAKRKPIC